MTSPLDFASFAPILMIVWFLALFVPLGELIAFKYGRRLPARPMLYVASRYLCIASLFTIFGIAQRAYFLGLISLSFEIFTGFVAVLAVVSATFAGRLATQVRP